MKYKRDLSKQYGEGKQVFLWQKGLSTEQGQVAALVDNKWSHLTTLWTSKELSENTNYINSSLHHIRNRMHSK